MRENRTHGSEGGDGESRSRPLSVPGSLLVFIRIPGIFEGRTKDTKI